MAIPFTPLENAASAAGISPSHFLSATIPAYPSIARLEVARSLKHYAERLGNFEMKREKISCVMRKLSLSHAFAAPRLKEYHRCAFRFRGVSPTVQSLLFTAVLEALEKEKERESERESTRKEF